MFKDEPWQTAKLAQLHRLFTVVRNGLDDRNFCDLPPYHHGPLIPADDNQYFASEFER